VALALLTITEFKRLMWTQTPIGRRMLATVRGRVCFTPEKRGNQSGFRRVADAPPRSAAADHPAGSAGGSSPTGFSLSPSSHSRGPSAPRDRSNQL